jgi:hypothetical protein
MIEKFVEEYVKLIVNDPSIVTVNLVPIDDTMDEIIINTGRTDAGRVIGKEGKMIGNIKTLISGCKAKSGKSYKVLVKSVEE